MRHKIWIISGISVFVVLITFLLVLLFMFIMNMMKGEAYQLSLIEIKSHPDVIEIVGLPVKESTFVLGNISTSGVSGEASLQYWVEGPKGKVTVYLTASKSIGKWNLDQLVAENKNTGRRIKIFSNGFKCLENCFN